MFRDENSNSKRNMNIYISIKNSWPTESINCLSSTEELPIIAFDRL